MLTELQTWPQNAFSIRDCASPHVHRVRYSVRACLICHSYPQPGIKDALVPRRFFQQLLSIPFFPLQFLHRPCHTSGHGELHPPYRPLACAGRYDVASEKNASARPPVLYSLDPSAALSYRPSDSGSIIDNVNSLNQKHPGLLNLFQDYAKRGADEGTATVVFVSNEGRIPRHMRRKSIRL